MVHAHEWSIKQLGEDIVRTLDGDKDFPIAITGFPGSGKSTLAWHIAKEVDPNFDIKTQMIFTRNDFLNAVNTLPPKKTIIVDEAVSILFRRDFMNTKQKAILKIMDMIRYKNFCIIFCLPTFWSLDSHLLTRIRVRCHIEKRGLSILFGRSNNPFVADFWFQKDNQKLCWNWDYNPDARKAKGFMGIAHFGDLPNYAKEIYLPLKEEKKVLRDEEDKKDSTVKVSDRQMRFKLERDKLIKYMVEVLKIKQTAIGEILGMNQAAISKVFHPEITKQTISVDDIE